MSSTAGDEPWPPGVLKGVADVLGDTNTGLTGSEIDRFLVGLKMEDPAPAASKRARLDVAFQQRQRTSGSPRRVITFITRAMEPAGYVSRQALFTLRQDQLNEVLTFVASALPTRDKWAVAPCRRR